METVVGFTAIAVAILIGLARSRCRYRDGSFGRPLSGRLRTSAGTGNDVADQDVPGCCVARRRGDDWRRYCIVLRVRESVYRAVSNGDRRLICVDVAREKTRGSKCHITRSDHHDDYFRLVLYEIHLADADEFDRRASDFYRRRPGRC